MSKVLFVSHIANFQKFNRPLMRRLSKAGYQVYYASAGEEVIQDCHQSFSIAISRSPYSFKNLKGIWQLRKIIKQQKITLVHCHTPMGGVVARLANFLAGKDRAKIIYTAHGFHFFKGAPLKNWLIYYPIEKILAMMTDAIITINQEDYMIASQKFKAKTYKIDGVGIDLERFRKSGSLKKETLKRKYGLKDDDFVVMYVADLRRDKNQSMILKNVEKIKAKIPKAKFLFAGKNTYNKINKLIQQTADCKFLGYRNDIDKLMRASNVALSTSVREGLATNVIEAIASGTPVVCTNIRGHYDIIDNGINGLLFDVDNDHEMIEKIYQIYKNPVKTRKIIKNGLKTAKRFDQKSLIDQTYRVYGEVLNEE